MAWHPGLDRSGKTIGYNERVAVTFNWWRRCMLGLRGQLQFASGFFIEKAPEYANMSMARKAKLRAIYAKRREAIDAMDHLIVMIEEFQRLPIDLEREAKGIKPRVRKKATLEPSQDEPSALPSA